MERSQTDTPVAAPILAQDPAGAARQHPARPRRSRRGLSLIEVTVAAAITAVATLIVVQTFILTMRTTEQTASQTDVQSQARNGLAQMERELRDSYAILTRYTPQNYGSTAGTTPVTYVTGGSSWPVQTLVAAVPSVDTAGAPCAFQGITLSYDVIVWQATGTYSSSAMYGYTWTMKRKTFPHAFEMPASYFHARRPSPDWPFRTILLGQMTPTANYTLPTSFGRALDQAGTILFRDCPYFWFWLYKSDNNWAGWSFQTPDLATPSADMPKLVTATGLTSAMPVTSVSQVTIDMWYSKNVASTQTVKGGQILAEDRQTLRIQLRNKPGGW